jgi:hypothetical protein
MTETYTLSNHTTVLQEIEPDPRDPRGLIWLFEKPSDKATYIIGVDPAMGRAHWDRSLRTQDDEKTDNSAIEVVRLGKNGRPDAQVAEFAAPVDPYDLAAYVNFLGRLYKGVEEETAMCIIETYPGPGHGTQHELIEKFGYTNFFQQKYIDDPTPRSRSFGSFYAMPKDVRELWIRGTRHIISRKIELRSTFLVEELAGCIINREKARGMAAYGSKDDRVSALLLCIYARLDWTGQVLTEDAKLEVEIGPPKDWQRRDCSAEEMMEDWERLWAATEIGDKNEPGGVEYGDSVWNFDQ